MLVLSRRSGQVLHIGEDIQVIVLGIDGDHVRIGINAPRDVVVLRRELLSRKSAVSEKSVTKSAV